MLQKRFLYALGLVGLLSASLLYISFFLPTTQACGEKIGNASVSKSNPLSVHFDGVTKFHLQENRFPNAITTASDGSVWFGEQDVPGVAHLYPNGTIVEYAWPLSYSPSTTSIWGIAEWNGRVWASDGLGHQVVGLDSSTAAVYAIRTTDVTAFPYTVTVGPDNALWFTELFVSKLARIDLHCKLTEYTTPTSFGGTPTQVAFANSTAGYYLDAGNATSGLGTILSFDPKNFSPRPVYGSFNLRAPSSLAFVRDGIWVAQHASSNLAFYDLSRGQWELFATSPVDYEGTTLPYFVATNGSLVWFNEHYANRLAKLDGARGLLTEYSLSDPPASKITRIDNALTFALGKDRVWFTEFTANYVGYLDASYTPNFAISSVSNLGIKIRPGGRSNVTFTVSGHSTKPLTVRFADTENFTSQPQRITMNPSLVQIPVINGRETITVSITTAKTLSPGDFTLLVTVTDGLINQGVYLKLEIAT